MADMPNFYYNGGEPDELDRALLWQEAQDALAAEGDGSTTVAPADVEYAPTIDVKKASAASPTDSTNKRAIAAGSPTDKAKGKKKVRTDPVAASPTGSSGHKRSYMSESDGESDDTPTKIKKEPGTEHEKPAKEKPAKEKPAKKKVAKPRKRSKRDSNDYTDIGIATDTGDSAPDPAKISRSRRGMLKRIDQNLWVLQPGDKRIDQALVKTLEENKGDTDKYKKSPTSVRLWNGEVESELEPLAEILRLMCIAKTYSQNGHTDEEKKQIVDQWFAAKEKHGIHYRELAQEFARLRGEPIPEYPDEVNSDMLDDLKNEIQQKQNDFDRMKTDLESKLSELKTDLESKLSGTKAKLERKLADTKAKLESKLSDTQAALDEAKTNLLEAQTNLAAAKADLALEGVAKVVKEAKTQKARDYADAKRKAALELIEKEYKESLAKVADLE